MVAERFAGAIATEDVMGPEKGYTGMPAQVEGDIAPGCKPADTRGVEPPVVRADAAVAESFEGLKLDGVVMAALAHHSTARSANLNYTDQTNKPSNIP
jgi:hypothetical protein